jgi:hypothetical protein
MRNPLVVAKNIAVETVSGPIRRDATSNAGCLKMV